MGCQEAIRVGKPKGDGKGKVSGVARVVDG